MALLRNLFIAAGFLLVSSLSHASLLYQVSGNGLAKPSYLFGTMHIICQQQFKMDERIESAFANADSLVMEIDMTAPDFRKAMQGIMFQPEGPYLEQYLNPTQVSVVSDYVESSTGIPFANLANLRPFALTSMLMQAQFTCDETASYEAYFSAQAAAQSKPIYGLETVEFQGGLFTNIPLKEQSEWLYELAAEPEIAQQGLLEMVDVYLNENVEELYQLVTDDPSMAQYSDLLLHDRNKTWAAKLPEKMASESVFIAVGAGHLGGEQGVIALLRNKGYKVTAL